jgi:tetratricopeptide (TPR) repeat protein
MMRLHNLGLSAFVCLLVVFSTSWVPNLSMVFTASQVLAQTGNQRKTEADRLLQQGFQQAQNSQFTPALQSWRQALQIYREIKDRLGEGQSLGNLGNAYLNLGEYPKAIEYEQQWLAIAREIKDRQSEGKALGNLGNAYLNLGEYPKAIEYQQQVLAIAREIKDRQSEGQSLGNLGLAYFSLGEYSKAIEYEQQWLAIAREIKNRQSEGISLNNLGLTFYKSGNFFAAEKTLYKGIKVYESLRSKKLDDTNKVSIFETQSNIYHILQQVLITENKSDAAL